VHCRLHVIVTLSGAACSALKALQQGLAPRAPGLHCRNAFRWAALITEPQCSRTWLKLAVPSRPAF